MGLLFLVFKGVWVLFFLCNIYKELQFDFGIVLFSYGDLMVWVVQGVFLLNVMLIVEYKMAGVYQKIGWQDFIDVVICKLLEKCEGLVFMLWGGFVCKKKMLIDVDKYLVFEVVYFFLFVGGVYFGSVYFFKVNEYFKLKGKNFVDW